MTEQEIKDNAPSGATHYKIMKDRKPLYFDGDHNYWNWIACKWEKTIVHYFEDDIKPL